MSTIILDGSDSIREASTSPTRPRTRHKTSTVQVQQRKLFEYTCSACPNIGTLSIYPNDVHCLDAEEYLNDTIIDFWISHYCDNIVDPKDFKRIVVFSTLFYRNLQRRNKTARSASRSSSSLAVQRTFKSWTKRVGDLFTKEFIFLPIPEEEHWVLAVICFPGLVYDAEHQKYDGDNKEIRERHGELKKFVERRKSLGHSPMIIIFDSFRALKIDWRKSVGYLREFLRTEWVSNYETDIKFSEDEIQLLKPKVPQQNNWYDCGIYTLEFFEAFFYNPFLPCSSPLSLKDWFQFEDVADKRQHIYDKITKFIRDLHPDLENTIPALKKSVNQNSEQENNDFDVTQSDEDDEYVPLVEPKKIKMSTVSIPRPPTKTKPRQLPTTKKCPKQKLLQPFVRIERYPTLFDYPEFREDMDICS